MVWISWMGGLLRPSHIIGTDIKKLWTEWWMTALDVLLCTSAPGSNTFKGTRPQRPSRIPANRVLGFIERVDSLYAMVKISGISSNVRVGSNGGWWFRDCNRSDQKGMLIFRNQYVKGGGAGTLHFSTRKSDAIFFSFPFAWHALSCICAAHKWFVYSPCLQPRTCLLLLSQYLLSAQ